MIVLAAVLATVIACYLHTRSIGAERERADTRIREQENRHNAHITKLLASQANERALHHQAMSEQGRLWDKLHAELVATHKAEREHAAEERIQLLNRVKPETAQPPLTYGPIIAPPAIPMDDDQAFYESQEQLAERLWRTERPGVSA